MAQVLSGGDAIANSTSVEDLELTIKFYEQQQRNRQATPQDLGALQQAQARLQQVKSNPAPTSTPNPAQRAWDTAKNVVKDVGGRVLNNTINALSQARQPGAPESPYLRAQAEQARQAAGQAQGDAQRGYQIANRNERVQGDQDAAASAAAQFTQGTAQTSGAAGAGAAALANMRTVDPSQYYAQHRQRADQQQQYAQERMDRSVERQLFATEADKQAAGQDYAFRDEQKRNAETQSLSMGEEAPQPPTETPQPQDMQNEESDPKALLARAAQRRVTDASVGLQVTPEQRQRLINAFINKQQGAWDAAALDVNNNPANKEYIRTHPNSNISNDMTLGGKYKPSDVKIKRIIKATKKRFI